MSKRCLTDNLWVIIIPILFHTQSYDGHHYGDYHYVFDMFFITWVEQCFLISLKQKNTIYFPFKWKKGPSNMTYCNIAMALHKVSNQRSYKEISIK